MSWIEYSQTGAITFLCASLLVCTACFALTWRDYRNGWKISVQTPGWLLIPLGIGIIAAINAYNPYAGKPQFQKTGVLIQKYRSTYYHHHWHGYGVLACVNDCTGDVPLLELNESASAIWETSGTGKQYSVAYLAGKESVNVDIYRYKAHLVLRIDDAATGQNIYFVDTTQHWTQVALLASTALVCLITLIACMRIAAKNPDLDGVSSTDSDDDNANPDEVAALALESQDVNRSK